MAPPRRSLWKWFLVAAVLFSAQIVPRWWSDSIVLDEEFYLTASYYYWKTGDVWTASGTTAPGALCALPLLAMDLKFDRAPSNYMDRSLKFLFLDNRDHLAAVTAWSRAIHWLFGLLIGFLLYRLTRGAPPVEGAAALVLWAFEPTLLAYSGTARTDIAEVLWFFLCFVLYSRVQNSKRFLPFAGAGFLAGLAAAARYNGLLALAGLAVLEALRCRGIWGDGKKIQAQAVRAAGIVLGFTAAIGLCFLPGTLAAPNNPSPFSFYSHQLGGYLDLRPEISQLPVFFDGKFWPGGSYFEFPYHFFFKNTLPFFLLVVLGAFGIATKRISLPVWTWMPPLLYLSSYYLLSKSMTVRHALPAYPFLILIAAKTLYWLWKKLGPSPSPLVRSIPFLLLGWHGLSVLAAFPHHIAYANDLLSTEGKAGRLYSFNWNLGQDMKRLAELGQKRGWKKVKLITSQRTDPYFYGLDWEPWTDLDLVRPQPGTVYVLDPSITRGHAPYSDLFFTRSNWVGRLPASGNIGGTLYYYEIPGDPDRALKDPSRPINSFPYYPHGLPPYKSALAKTKG